MSAIKQETMRTANAVFDTIVAKSEPVSAGDIAREFNLPAGRHSDIASALKHLVKQDKVVKLGEGRGSRYLSTENHLKPAPITPAEQAEQSTVPPVPEVKTRKQKPSPVRMVEIPYATLKVLVKAVMSCCTPMDNTLQRATLQCMEKLI